MQIIINIPKEIYKASQIIGGKFDDVIQIPLEVIANCTVLPEKHGRLIDADAIHQAIEELPLKDTAEWFNWLQKTCLRIAYAPTILDAEMESD